MSSWKEELSSFGKSFIGVIKAPFDLVRTAVGAVTAPFKKWTAKKNAETKAIQENQEKFNQIEAEKLNQKEKAEKEMGGEYQELARAELNNSKEKINANTEKQIKIQEELKRNQEENKTKAEHQKAEQKAIQNNEESYKVLKATQLKTEQEKEETKQENEHLNQEKAVTKQQQQQLEQEKIQSDIQVLKQTLNERIENEQKELELKKATLETKIQNQETIIEKERTRTKITKECRAKKIEIELLKCEQESIKQEKGVTQESIDLYNKQIEECKIKAELLNEEIENLHAADGMTQEEIIENALKNEELMKNVNKEVSKIKEQTQSPQRINGANLDKMQKAQELELDQSIGSSTNPLKRAVQLQRRVNEENNKKEENMEICIPNKSRPLAPIIPNKKKEQEQLCQ